MKVVLDKGAYMPERAHETDAGFDIRTPQWVFVPAHGSALVDTGVHIELPSNKVGFLKSKSGLMVNNGITCEGVIDAGYTGSIKAMLFNHSDKDYLFEQGDKITQLVILQYYAPKLKKVETLEKTERGNNGFGSTGL